MKIKINTVLVVLWIGGFILALNSCLFLDRSARKTSVSSRQSLESLPKCISSIATKIAAVVDSNSKYSKAPSDIEDIEADISDYISGKVRSSSESDLYEYCLNNSYTIQRDMLAQYKDSAWTPDVTCTDNSTDDCCQYLLKYSGVDMDIINRVLQKGTCSESTFQSFCRQNRDEIVDSSKRCASMYNGCIYIDPDPAFTCY